MEAATPASTERRNGAWKRTVQITATNAPMPINAAWQKESCPVRLMSASPFTKMILRQMSTARWM